MSLEDSLIRLAVTGDREAQRLVYESLKDSINRLVSRVVDVYDVDDVTQDIFSACVLLAWLLSVRIRFYNLGVSAGGQ